MVGDNNNDGKFAYKPSAGVVKRNAVKKQKFEGFLKTKETKRVGRYA
jgi:hypothetical protein